MTPQSSLFLEFLTADDDWRRNAMVQLSRRLNQSPRASGQVLCHRPCGLYVLLPVPLARRLMEALSMVCDAQALR
jgi:hypothetical protein